LAPRSLTLGLRKNPGFRRLDFLGFPWILSSEMSLFNGLRAAPEAFLFSLAPPFRNESLPSGSLSETDGAAADLRMDGL
jgi:hypothetical protein